jgi:uncharacterized delta-60 repeat protein
MFVRQTSALTLNPNSRRYLQHILGFLVLLTLMCAVVFGGPADLDPTFGNAGRVLANADGTGNKWASCMALQADGKIVMAGSGGTSPNFFVARFNSDGTPDLNFGTSGYTSIVFPGESSAYEVQIQSDGKIVVAGHYYSTTTPFAMRDFAVARLNSDGSPDTSFDTDGKATISFTGTTIAGYTKFFSAMRIAADGKIVLAGHALLSATDDRFMFARFNTDGTPDATFGNAGRYVALANGGGHNNDISDMVILSDGSIVVSGWVIIIGGNFRFVRKYNSLGTDLVWAYSQGFSNQIPGSAHAFLGLAIQPDGKFIAVGKKDDKITVERINPDGTGDNTFVTPTMPQGQALTVAIQSDGKIVAHYIAGGASSYSVMRLNSNGSMDTGFGAGGFKATAAVNSSVDSAARIIVQPDGKILVGGHTSSATENLYGIVRYRGGNLIPEKALYDYDGDSKSDVSVFRPSNGTWYLNRSTSGVIAAQWGSSGDQIVPADYDGDAKADLAIYRNGEWWVIRSSDATVSILTFGIAGDKPQPGDFDGDGKDDPAVYRPSTGVWYMFRSSDNGYSAIGFGVDTDIPVRADYDDDGKCDIAVFRPSFGTWYIQQSTGGYQIVQFGISGDIPVAADYDGDSRPDIAVYRQAEGKWYILQTANGQLKQTTFGLAGDVPVPADYNGDGKADIAIFRPTNATWYQLLSPSGTWAQQVFGSNGDVATPGAFNP